ncbi:hypothetical protein NKH18_12240 [Streptomyces sp. M10(2022)]
MASALLAPVCALIGLGLGVLIRHSATTVLTGAFTLLMLPMFFSPSERWSAAVNHSMAVSAWRRLVQNWGRRPATALSPSPPSPAPGPCTHSGR